MPLTENLKWLRKSKGLTVVSCAEQLGFPRSRYSKWENGTNNPTFEDLRVIADYYEVTTDYLLGGDSQDDKAAEIIADTVSCMKSLNTYRPQYDSVISIYADLRTQYDAINDKFRESGYKCEERTADGGTKKSAIVSTLENLRKDILAYSDRLCLNPKALTSAKIKPPKKASTFESMLSQINGKS